MTEENGNGNTRYTLRDLDKRLRDVETSVAGFKAVFIVLQFSIALNLLVLGNMSRAYFKLF